MFVKMQYFDEFRINDRHRKQFDVDELCEFKISQYLQRF